jgi:hypothetical protein
MVLRVWDVQHGFEPPPGDLIVNESLQLGIDECWAFHGVRRTSFLRPTSISSQIRYRIVNQSVVTLYTGNLKKGVSNQHANSALLPGLIVWQTISSDYNQ